MPDTPTDEGMKRRIRECVRGQPLGDGRTVKCGDCGSPIETETRAKGYVIGNASGRWKLAKVFHPDCGRRFAPENIGDNDDTEGIVEGVVVHDPSVSAGIGGPGEVSGENVAVIQAEPGQHRLEEVEVLAVHLMSDERQDERREAMEQGREVLRAFEEGRTEDLPPFWREMVEESDSDSTG